MPVSQAIQILPSQQIDKQKWNECIGNSSNECIYARYNYLQQMADNWDGIVVNDYEAIMPLPYRKKWGIRYYYHVPFVQQLGVFGRYGKDLLEDVIAVAVKHIRYGDLFFNFQNEVAGLLPGARKADNYVLPLSRSYDAIYKNYERHLQTKLKKAGTKGLFFVISDYDKNVISFFQELYAHRLPHLKNEDFNRLHTLATALFQVNQCFVCSVCNQKLNVVATALFFTDANRIYNILPSTTAEGRKLNAMHFLLDNVIAKYAETRLLLDFEGSDVPGIRQFYQSFGAVNQPYYHYHFNHLPFPLRLLKR